MTDFAKQISAYQELTRIYDSLNSVIDVMEDPAQENMKKQLPIADQFVRKATDATSKIISIYSDIMSRENSVATQQEISAIEKEIRTIIVDAMQDVVTGFQNIERTNGSETTSATRGEQSNG